MRIAMIGTGYVGLVSGACLCDFGHEVVCIDHDAAKIAALRGGEIPIYEPGLAEVVANNLAAGRLSFTTTLAEGAHKAQAIFIAVGTPTLPGEDFSKSRPSFWVGWGRTLPSVFEIETSEVAIFMPRCIAL